MWGFNEKLSAYIQFGKMCYMFIKPGLVDLIIMIIVVYELIPDELSNGL